MNCLLCQKNDADQTGSHITSAFLIASQIGKRGEEVSHVITTDPDQDYSENKGDTDITEDHVFCRDCEKRISFIENIFSDEITNKIEESTYTDNFPETNTEESKYLSCIRINPIAFHLMIYSTIWRASISTQPIYSNFNLDDINEEDLQFTLDLFLPNVVDHKIIQKKNDWETMVEYCQELFNYFPYFLVKAESIEDKSQTFEFYDNITFDPYHIMLNEYLILPFLKKIEVSEDFFQVRSNIDFQSINNRYEHGKIVVISNDQFISIIQMIRNLVVMQRIKVIEQECIVEMESKGEDVDPDKLKKMIEERVNQIQFES